MQSPVPPPWTWCGPGDLFVAAECRGDAARLLRSPASSFCFSPDLWGSLCLDDPSQVLLFSPAAMLEETEATQTGHVQVLQPTAPAEPRLQVIPPQAPDMGRSSLRDPSTGGQDELPGRACAEQEASESDAEEGVEDQSGVTA